MDFGKSCLSEISENKMDEQKINDVSDGVFEVAEASGFNLEALAEMEQIEQISNFIDGLDEVKIENWEKLTLNERTEVLQRIENKTAEITGRSPLQVEVKRMPAGSRGEMDWNAGKIRINHDLVSSNNLGDLRQTVTTLAHESRHAYQWSNLIVKRTEISDEKFEAWRTNIDEIGYDSPDRMGFKRYYIQPVEVDARVFAESVAQKISFR